MKYLITLLFVLGGLTASAQTFLKRPLQFVPADSVFVLPRGDQNIIMDIMNVAPFIGPRPIIVTKAERKAAKQQGEDFLANITESERTYRSAQMLLLTGDGHYAEALNRGYFKTLRQGLKDDGILPAAEREAAAQQLLDLTGTIIATDQRHAVYVNLLENCVARVNTGKVRLLLDIISGYPDEAMVKLRIEGLDTPSKANAKSNLVPFALHIRLPEGAMPDKFFLNGHEIIRPVIVDGYLVIDRKWRNGEEVYFILN